MLNIILLFLGAVMLIAGLLQATNKKVQRWFFLREKKNQSIDVNSAEYKTAVFHMNISGGGLAMFGGMLILMTLSNLGIIR